MKHLPRIISKILLLTLITLGLSGCPLGSSEPGETKGRAVMFIGMDISGSFMQRWFFEDSIRFLAHYIYAHLNGFDGLAKPSHLFVGSIGGAKQDEPKTFYPIQTFEHRSVAEIETKLREIFPKKVQNPFTDYNAFFEQISVHVRNKKLVLKPISIVMLSDGIPDAKNRDGRQEYRTIKLKSLENLARDITLRVLYTSAEVGMNWQTRVPRDRVKIWSQDADVMKSWKDDKIFQPGLPFSQQSRFFHWLKENVDFGVARKRVD
jgi:hypothetical protein